MSIFRTSGFWQRVRFAHPYFFVSKALLYMTVFAPGPKLQLRKASYPALLSDITTSASATYLMALAWV